MYFLVYINVFVEVLCPLSVPSDVKQLKAIVVHSIVLMVVLIMDTMSKILKNMMEKRLKNRNLRLEKMQFM